MFSSNDRSTYLTCGFKVNTECPEWHKSMTRILKRIKGGEFVLDAEEGMAYVSGEGDPNKLLKVMGSIKGRAAQMVFVKTGGRHHQRHHRYPNLDHSSHFNSNSQSLFYNTCYLGYSWHHPTPYCSHQSPVMQPYHYQYSYPDQFSDPDYPHQEYY